MLIILRLCSSLAIRSMMPLHRTAPNASPTSTLQRKSHRALEKSVPTDDVPSFPCPWCCHICCHMPGLGRLLWLQAYCTCTCPYPCCCHCQALQAFITLSLALLHCDVQGITGALGILLSPSPASVAAPAGATAATSAACFGSWPATPAPTPAPAAAAASPAPTPAPAAAAATAAPALSLQDAALLLAAGAALESCKPLALAAAARCPSAPLPLAARLLGASVIIFAILHDKASIETCLGTSWHDVDNMWASCEGSSHDCHAICKARGYQTTQSWGRTKFENAQQESVPAAPWGVQPLGEHCRSSHLRKDDCHTAF